MLDSVSMATYDINATIFTIKHGFSFVNLVKGNPTWIHLPVR